MAVTLNLHDLEFILRQIKIAEAHAAGTPLTDLLEDAHLPFGLRTVDGSYNNLVAGRETWGSSDQPLPRLFDAYYRNEADLDSFDPDGPGPAPAVTNNDYGQTGSVADADPRIISNLIVDQTAGNPAAISAALTHTGYEGDASAAILAIHTAWNAFEAGTGTREAFDLIVADHGLSMQGDSLMIPNIAPDEGLSAPFNAWMTYFGQFFDHGLDLIPKGGNGTVYVPLQPDDPLYVEGGHTNFMVMTRAQIDENGETPNTTTPFVDQNQTYGSHASKQFFMREYVLVDGKPQATGHLLEGASGGLATWADVKAQALNVLGIVLSDKDMGAIPLVRTDPYGNFIPDANGMPQIVTGIGPDMIPNTSDDAVASGNLADPLHLLLGAAGEVPASANSVVPVRIAHAFLDDIAHTAGPVIVNGNLVQDADGETGNSVGMDMQGRNTEYDNELLDRHFITGDGRGNENIGLTAVHHVFHSEHNRQVEANQLEILRSGDLAFINEWLDVALTQVEVDAIAGMSEAQLGVYSHTLDWDGERLFQVAKFATEMQYQHLVFEEFARKLQPNIDPFVFNSVTDVDPAIFAEFAHVVYRFGHSMLTEDIGRMFLDANGNPVTYNSAGEAVAVTDLESWDQPIGLIEAFLNPVEFDLDGTITADQAAGAIFRGLNLEHGNHIDEFVTDALRNNLLGLPLDLATINIARGRDTGMPTLNQAREQLFDASGSSWLKPYESWAEFASNLKNPMSVINFIAAYGTHQSILDAGDNAEARRDAATLLVLGQEGETPEAQAERLAFLNGPAASTGVNAIDMWIGGLAEATMPFGGFLGSTFNAVFELQLEMLQDNDRFYYLTRTQGLNLLDQLENNAFSKLIMANTDQSMPGADGIRGTQDDVLTYGTHVDSFALADIVLNVDPTKQIGPDPQHDNAALNAVGQTLVQRDDLATPGVDQNYLRFIGAEHIVVTGTDGNDRIIAGAGDDGIWGGNGNDRIEAGHGVDLVIGGAGDDIITDSGDTGDFLKGEAGNDVIANSNGIDILMGGEGNDAFIVGVDATEVFAGEGDDFVLGGADADFLLGNEGDDWLEGGDGFDTTAGDNSELFFNSTIIGHDVMFAGGDEHDFDAESGDDIMVQGESVMRNEGMFGFDWSSYQGSRLSADADLTIKIFTTEQANILRNRFDKVEALSGSDNNDVLRGDDRGDPNLLGAEADLTNDQLTQAGVDRIEGLREALGLAPRGDAGDDETAFTDGNILFGGGGSDVLEGRGGNDVIDGDMRLNVRISITNLAGDTELGTVTSLKEMVTIGGVTKPLTTHLLSGAVNPAQLHIVREVVNDGQEGDQDTALFYDDFENYQLTLGQDGAIIVTHVNPTAGVLDPFTGQNRVSDGVDTVRNVEFLQFRDGIVAVSDINLTATGEAVLSDSTPTEGAPLTVDTSSIGDANGITSSTIQWQQSVDGVTWVDIPGATGAGFTPDDQPGTTPGAQAGQMLRVAFNYVDGLGVNKSLYSAATGIVGLNWQTVAAATFTATNGDDILTGSGGDDTLVGAAGVDLIFGGGGNDRLSGATGADTTNGGLGDDIHYVDNVSDVVFEAVGQGNDTVITQSSYALSAFAQIEKMWVAQLTGTDAVDLAGNDFGQAITGNDGDNIIDGQGGNDILRGRLGNDTLLGGAGNDFLHGDEGVDTTVGGLGNDTHSVDSLGDTVVEAVGEGTNDRVVALANYVLGAGAEIEVLSAQNGTAAINLTGNEFGQTLQGNDGANVLSGGDGNDRLVGGGGADTTAGGAGNDLHYVESAADLVAEAVGEGTDRVFAQSSFTLAAGAEVETLSAAPAASTVALDLGGNEFAQFIYGNEGANVINGGGGDDRLFGNGGDDTFVQTGATDGHDMVKGGAGTDTWQVNAANGEAYTIYTRSEAIAAGMTGIAGSTEIVVTLNGSNNASIIAELDDIEEIVIDTLDVATGGAVSGGGTGSGATVTVVGDFTTTSLDFNTITVNGTGGDDLVDISGLTSAHRIVLNSGGGTDLIVGGSRVQDEIRFADGTVLTGGSGTSGGATLPTPSAVFAGLSLFDDDMLSFMPMSLHRARLDDSPFELQQFGSRFHGEFGGLGPMDVTSDGSLFHNSPAPMIDMRPWNHDMADLESVKDNPLGPEYSESFLF